MIWWRLLIRGQCADQKVIMIGQQVVAIGLCYWLDVLRIQIQETVIVTFVAENGLSTDSAAEDMIELASKEGLWCWHGLNLVSVEMITRQVR